MIFFAWMSGALVAMKLLGVFPWPWPVALSPLLVGAGLIAIDKSLDAVLAFLDRMIFRSK